MAQSRPQRRRPTRRTDDGLDALERAVASLLRTVQTLGALVTELDGTIRVIDRGTQAMTAFLTRQVAVLKTLLLEKGLVSPDEMVRADSLAECEALWEGPPAASPGGPPEPSA